MYILAIEFPSKRSLSSLILRSLLMALSARRGVCAPASRWDRYLSRYLLSLDDFHKLVYARVWFANQPLTSLLH